MSVSRNQNWGHRITASVLLGFLVSPAAGQLTNLTVEPSCVPGGTDVRGTVTVAPCRTFISCCLDGTCAFVKVDLTTSNPLLTSVPDQIIVDRPMNVAGTASFTIETSQPFICFPDPCPSASATITASDGSAPDPQADITIWRSSAFVKDVELDPPTVLGGTIALARVDLQCPAPPAGWSVQISSDDEALARPVADQFTIPEGQDSGAIEITTIPVTHLSQTEITITAAGTQHTLTLTVLPGSLDLTVRKLEVTQGIQYLDDDVFEDNSIPLVRGKTTAVRAYLESNTAVSVSNVPVSLMSRPCGTTSWVEHPPLWPYATVTPVDPANPEDSYRAQRETPNLWNAEPLNATFLVDPFYLESGCLDFRAEVNPDSLIVEEDYANNVNQSNGFLFQGTRNLNVKFVRIDWCPGCPFDETPRRKPSWNTIYPMISLLEKTYPVDRVNYWKARKEVAITSLTPHDFEKEAPWGYVLGALATLKGFTNDQAPNMHYYALLDENVPHDGTCGMAWMPPFPTVGMGVAAGNCGPETTIHEIGHNLDRLHAPCGNPDDPDPNWPSSTNPNTVIGQTGFDVDAGLALPGSSPSSGPVYVDFMSYCAPEWVSPYTYMAIHNRFTAASAAPDDTAPAGEPVDHVMVRGVIDENGDVQLGTIYHQDFLPGAHDHEGSGLYSLVLRDAKEQALFTRRFTPQLSDASGARAFFEIVPYQPRTVRVDVMVPGVKGDEVVESCEVSPGTPTIELISPNGGETFGDTGSVTLNWTASDPDEDPLVFAVLYSRDAGSTWEALAVDLPGPPFTADLSQLAGTSQGLFRIVASDGINTAHDDSDAAFTVARKGPEVAILNPPDRTRIAADSPVALRGAATDPEDGPLADPFLLWFSNREGLLGGGADLVAELSPGVHRVTLEGRDSDDNAASRSIHVVIGPAGDCDKSGGINLTDTAFLLNCLSGPATTAKDPACDCADVDADGDVDLFDYATVEELFAQPR